MMSISVINKWNVYFMLLVIQRPHIGSAVSSSSLLINSSLSASYAILLLPGIVKRVASSLTTGASVLIFCQ